MFSHHTAEKLGFDCPTLSCQKKKNGGYIHYPDLKQCTQKLFSDITHLSDIAQVLFLNAIQGGLYNIICKNARIYPPLSS